jgi:uncharacterized YigZ family protein
VSERFRAPTGEARAELRELGSRFFAFVAPAASADAAAAYVEALRRRHPDATHHCFAWRVGQPPAERAADAGEPSGTAGAPMLAALRGAGLTDTVAVVVRWFGGTKLGKGGLVRAYGGALRAALESLPTVEVRVRDRLSVALPYERLGAVKRLLQPPAVELAAERYGAAVELDLDVEPEARAALEAALADLGLAARAR